MSNSVLEHFGLMDNSGFGVDLNDRYAHDLVQRDANDARRSLRSLLDRFLLVRVVQSTFTSEEAIQFAAIVGDILGDREVGTTSIGSKSAELKVLSSARTESGTSIGDKGADAQVWHTDGSQRNQPNLYTILFAKKIPPNPPKTSFLSAYSLYETLPLDLKRTISKLQAVHSLHNRSQSVEAFFDGVAAPLEQRLEGPRHPLVRRHPNTNRPLLYMPRRRDALIEGMGEAQSRELMERLWAHVLVRTDFHSIALEENDLVLFDNCALLHNREGWDSKHDRTVLHLAIEGQAPEPMYR
ncbi:TauD/TfdA dioxygenase family protein [Sinorhizobium meliloti]|uniref:TauD/TfdA dioxygenase family protein n=1 Tax=Rhizobium meliloti TaxID=382 RepID=UPI000313847A|nr:TauD/TfdA family dioxygenase [Sinorhizobium meliloti]MDE3878755.1 TauD/TfdA family dioxygenase [Sinorhizobium meliloti]MDE4604561.1 TauD/TfdA family dioxygenase [Sinorhizobium meliloti]UDU21122.1 TauD/TfdA family dioxygenase [Sinorhizobium meliloti]